jgi:hypothetical protein
MTTRVELRPISRAGIPRAIEKAKQYRLLNDPASAESICLDILEADPENQEVLVVLILAMTDQFSSDRPPGVKKTRSYLARLTNEYQRAYYSGLIAERKGRSVVARGMSRAFAYACMEDALGHYEKAQSMSPEGDDDAILRWNSCVRIIRRAHLRPGPENERELPLE